jgi:hypothetical protein
MDSYCIRWWKSSVSLFGAKAQGHSFHSVVLYRKIDRITNIFWAIEELGIEGRFEVPEYGDRATLIIVTRSSDRRKDKSRDYKGIGSVLPGGFSCAKYDIPLDRPALLLTRFNGAIEYSDGVNKG